MSQPVVSIKTYQKKSFQMPEFVKVDHKKLCTLEEMMLNLRQDCQNHHPLR